MNKAYYYYLKWGATAKVQQLESLYPYLRVKTTDSLSKDTTTGSTTGNSQSFDLLTVVKASQALSSEIVVENLLEKLMHLVRENAGAEKVIFLDKQDEQLFIEAALIGENNVTVCQSLPVTKCDTLPKNLINYVNRTQTPLLLDDATQNKQFNYDSYIVENKPKSILVLPIMHQSTIVGILYLENNLATGAFTKDRLEVLQVIASQAAISLENARFYNTLEKRVAQRTQELQNALEELHRTQLQMIQSEKMSSLGQLVAGIAHEINNPISFIYGNLAPISEYVQSLLELVDIYLEKTPTPLPEFMEKAEEIDLEYIREDVPNLLNSLRTGAARIRDIVQTLRNFSRLDEAVIKDVELHEGIENTLMILQQRLGEIQVVKEYDRLPKVEFYAGEINQVFMSLLTNAIDAIEESLVQDKGQIQIRTELRQDNQVAICIADNGVGMTEEVKSKIFDPFFTTKPIGKANGLGLSISYQIVVEKHGGNLMCQSVPGEGTEFTILLPYS
ncbi:ATP-binding protein [Iningainema tapete]|uniref:histidine kinase n=1 Tax=Iningainema tapete BLCC-T55 TaxID=2748662 RepID=A0A8J6XL46_9CYAN|nr:ATP-binding protein [Iningainema tapete]MBD2778910.1 GAF domain-containing protein [Iningainema tapete BLCC-T55]